MREFILRNFNKMFIDFQNIPIEIFLEPFIKQLKIGDNKTYVMNIFDFELIKTLAQHRKLKVNLAI